MRLTKAESTLTELAGLVAAPAQDLAGVEEHTGVRPAGSQGRDAGWQALHVDRAQPLLGGSIPELSTGIVPPALHLARRQQRASVARAGGDGPHAAEARHRHGSGLFGGGSITQLAELVRTPAAHGGVL